MHFFNENHGVVIATNSGAFYTTDGGTSWTAGNTPDFDYSSTALSFHSSGVGYTGNVFGNVFNYTTDFGRNWQEIDSA